MPRYLQPLRFIGVIHEFGGDSANVEACGEFCRVVAQCLPNVIVLSPLHMFSYLDDHEVGERRLGIRMWRATMNTLCDEIWSVGACATEGCDGDLAECERQDIPVYIGYARMDELAPGWRAMLPEVVC